MKMLLCCFCCVFPAVLFLLCCLCCVVYALLFLLFCVSRCIVFLLCYLCYVVFAVLCFCCAVYAVLFKLCCVSVVLCFCCVVYVVLFLPCCLCVFVFLVYCVSAVLFLVFLLLNVELVSASNWLKANKLSLNLKKINSILFSSHRKLEPLHNWSALVDDSIIPQVKSTKFLLLFCIDQHLTWNDYIEHTSLILQ